MFHWIKGIMARRKTAKRTRARKPHVAAAPQDNEVADVRASLRQPRYASDEVVEHLLAENRRRFAKALEELATR